MNKEQFQEWRSNTTTIEIYKALEETKESLTNALATGGTLTDRADDTALKTARIVGNIEGLNQLLNISYEDETEEDESNG